MAAEEAVYQPFPAERAAFITFLAKGMDQKRYEHLFEAAPVSVVRLVLLTQYSNPKGRARLRGKTCVILGKETRGSKKDKWNIFGGSMDACHFPDPAQASLPWEDVPAAAKRHAVAAALFDETVEEAGLVLTPKLFNKAFLGVWAHAAGETMYFALHVSDLRRKWWAGIMDDPRREELPKCFRDMKEVEHFPVEDIPVFRIEDVDAQLDNPAVPEDDAEGLGALVNVLFVVRMQRRQVTQLAEEVRRRVAAGNRGVAATAFGNTLGRL